MPKYGTAQGQPPKVPPAPQTWVVAVSPKRGTASSEIPAILDSGAYKTCVPESCIADLGGDILWKAKECRGFSGPPKSMRFYRIHLRIPGCVRVFENIEVIGTDRHYALIGRDLLREYRIVLDGPNEEWSCP